MYVPVRFCLMKKIWQVIRIKHVSKNSMKIMLFLDLWEHYNYALWLTLPLFVGVMRVDSIGEFHYLVIYKSLTKLHWSDSIKSTLRGE